MRIVLALVQGRVNARHRLPSPARSKQLRRDDLGVIDHQHVAGAQEFWQISDLGVARVLRRDHQQTRGFARLGGTQRDPLFRQLEIEKLYPHIPAPGSRRHKGRARKHKSKKAPRVAGLHVDRPRPSRRALHVLFRISLLHCFFEDNTSW